MASLISPPSPPLPLQTWCHCGTINKIYLFLWSEANCLKFIELFSWIRSKWFFCQQKMEWNAIKSCFLLLSVWSHDTWKLIWSFCVVFGTHLKGKLIVSGRSFNEAARKIAVSNILAWARLDFGWKVKELSFKKVVENIELRRIAGDVIFEKLCQSRFCWEKNKQSRFSEKNLKIPSNHFVFDFLKSLRGLTKFDSLTSRLNKTNFQNFKCEKLFAWFQINWILLIWEHFSWFRLWKFVMQWN